jgi:cytochrome c biogenesis protein CcmG/thiol:disulfide interchange protein DsbE
MAKKSNGSKKKGLSAGAQWGIIVGIGVVIVGAIVFSGVRDAADDGGEGVIARESFDLPDLTDDENPDSRIRLADFEGTPTVVNFFASWCTACDAELPAFRHTALALEGEVDFIFVNSNESGNWKPMAERNDIEQFTLAKDIQGISRNGLYRDLGGTGGMPITAFYDAAGNLVDTAFTAFDESSLDRRLRALELLS